jgi:hypothetical protein
MRDEITLGDRRRKILRTTGAVVGALSYYLVFDERLWPGWSWYVGGLCWVLLGHLAGVYVGQWTKHRVPRFRRSDGPELFGSMCGVLVTAAAWWYVPLALTAIIGSLCRAIVGAYVGFMMVDVSTYTAYE